MRVVILSGTPKRDGLCYSCVNAALAGAEKAGADCEVIRLCDYKLARCAVCGDGWGICHEEHACCYGDDGFTEIQNKLKNADALILVTPVYWGDMSEVMKTFFDRFRRCEAPKRENGAIANKSVLLIASPGGSGNGVISCFEQLERLCRHLNAKIFDFVGVNRWTKDYKLITISKAAAAMVQEAK